MQRLTNLTTGIINLLYSICKDYGIAIVLFAILTRIVLLPLLFKIRKDTVKRKELTEKMNKIKYKYIHDKEKMDEELKLLKETEAFPLTGAYLIILIQIPLFFLLYKTISTTQIGESHTVLIPWILNLKTKDVYFILPIIMAVTRLIPILLDLIKSKRKFRGAIILSILFSATFSLIFINNVPAGVGIYFITVSILTIIENKIIARTTKTKNVRKYKK
jgi:YidC/Oxa1 family membrane protein insertase